MRHAWSSLFLCDVVLTSKRCEIRCCSPKTVWISIPWASDCARGGCAPANLWPASSRALPRAATTTSGSTSCRAKPCCSARPSSSAAARRACPSTASRLRSRTTSTSRATRPWRPARLCLCSRGQRAGGVGAARRWCDCRRQDQPRPVRRRPRRHPLALRCLRQQLRSQIRVGRIERRLCGRGSCGPCEFLAGRGYRRLWPRAGCVQ